MAIYHCAVKIIGKSTGRNIVRAAAYRAGCRLADGESDSVFDYSRRRDVVARRVCLPHNAPTWMADRRAMWHAVQARDQRRNSQHAREFEVALPHELNLDQQQALVERFVTDAFVNEGLVADYAIHAKPGNIHAHILVTLRPAHAEGFGAKRRDLNTKEAIFRWREQWAMAVNHALKDAQAECSPVDHRSLAAQGINRMPSIHVGSEKAVPESVRQSRIAFNEYVKVSEAVEVAVEEIELVERQVEKIASEIIDLESSLAMALAERDRSARQPTAAEDLPSGFTLGGLGVLVPSHLIGQENYKGAKNDQRPRYPFFS